MGRKARTKGSEVKFPIPEKALHQHIVVLGKTGRGKSSAMRGGFVEPLLDDDEPVCIIDPKGDWWGLKSSADGKRAGYPVVIFGGEHADVPINEHSGHHIAELVATGNRPCIIDLGGWMVGERTRFFIAFASALFKLTKGRRWLVIDECHNFAPQGKILDVDAGKMLHWANRLASEGRGKGINIIAASQRPQKVHKDFLTSMETLIAMGVVHKLDRDAVKDWIDGCADPATGKEVIATLAGLPRGEGWVWSPEIDFGPKRIAFPFFTTYDSFKPQAADAGKLKGWAEVDLDDVKTKLAAVVEEHKANDPGELKKQIRDLQKQLAAKPQAGHTDAEWRAAMKQAEDLASAAAFARGSAAGYAKGVEDVANAAEGMMTNVSAEISSLASAAQRDRKTFQDIVAATKREGAKIAPTSATTISRQIPRGQPAESSRLSGAPSRALPRPSPTKSHSNGEALPKGEAATLAACIQFPDGLRREQLTVLTGYKRSTRDAYIQRLRERGYIDVVGDLVVATDAGVAAMPDAEPLPTGKDLQDYWLSRLPKGEREILEVLIENYPQAVPRGDLDERTGFARSSRDAYLQRMAAKQLVTEPSRGEVRASENLF